VTLLSPAYHDPARLPAFCRTFRTRPPRSKFQARIDFAFSRVRLDSSPLRCAQEVTLKVDKLVK
jgi:hypothetical protein